MLRDLLVIDLSRVLAGPYCTQLLADLGARVIKLEPPRGDDTRGWGPPFAGGESGYFLSVNRGKESVAVDLKHEAGRRVARRLVERADVLVENFKVGDLARYGLDYASLAATRPGLVYASITGFGATGPRAREPGYDAALQAMTGVMAMTGEEGGGPVKLGVAWIDVLTGLHASTAILAALRERDATGRGRHLQLSLFEVGLASLVNQAQGALLTNEPPRRLGSAHPSIVPYEAFETADRPLMLAVGNDAQFARLARVVGRSAWAEDERFRTNAARVAHREALVPLLRERLRTAPRDAWLARLREASVSATPVNDLAAALRDPQAEALGTVGSYAHPTAGEVPFVRSPLRHASGPPGEPAPAPAAEAAPPPLVGEHTRAVLEGTLGLGAEEVEALLEAGAVAAVDPSAAAEGRDP